MPNDQDQNLPCAFCFLKTSSLEGAPTKHVESKRVERVGFELVLGGCRTKTVPRGRVRGTTETAVGASRAAAT